MTNNQTKSRLNSTGFFTNLINLVFIAAAGLGVTFGMTGEETLQAFLAKNYEILFSVVLPSFLALVFKIVEAVGQKVNILKTIVNSPNFWNQAITVVLSAINIFVPIAFPADAGEKIYGAFEGMQLFTIVAVIATNVITPILYYLKDRKLKQLTT